MNHHKRATLAEKTVHHQPTVQQKAYPETLVTGIGLSCVVGDQPFALLGAVGTNMSASRPNPLIRVKVPQQESELAVMSAPVAELDGVELAAERMEILASQALDKASEFLPHTLDNSKLLVVTLLPSQGTTRGATTKNSSFRENLASLVPRLSTAEFRFVEASTGSTKQLIEVCGELAAGTWQAMLFGGVDSLVDTVSCTELALNGRIMTVGGSEGLVSGEAATYLLLQAVKSKPAQVLAHITSAAQREEPQSGKADQQMMTGQVAAIQAALGHVDLPASSLDGVILPYGSDTASTLEWHQVTQKIWPPETKEQPEAVEQPTQPPLEQKKNREELHLHIAVGETGAATLPLSLALACARFEFHHPSLSYLLVCDGGDALFRGAVLLQTGKKN